MDTVPVTESQKKYSIPHSLQKIGPIVETESSLPSELDVLSDEDFMAFQLQNLKVENAMLNNEINVLKKEQSEVFARYRQMEGELHDAQSALNSSNHNTMINKATMTVYYENLNQSHNQIEDSEVKYKDLNDYLLKNDQLLLENNDDNNMEKRLKREWDAYKAREKSMLTSKDNVIKALLDGVKFCKDTKQLMLQIKAFKDGYRDMSDCISSPINHFNSPKLHIDRLGEFDNSMDLSVTALRHALVKKRGTSDKAYAQCINLTKAKFQTEAPHVRNTHSIVNVDHLLLRLGVMMKWYSVIRILIIIYVFCLFVWIVTVLFTSGPPKVIYNILQY